MEEDFETDYMSEFLDNIFKFPCDNCNDKCVPRSDFNSLTCGTLRAECNFEDRSKCCEKRIGTMLKAERIA